MSIEDFLGRLEAVSPTGEGKWIARCPAHPDGNPSLGVAVGSDGRILLHCYAGCTAEAVVEALGLKMSDLMPDKEEGRGQRVEGRGKRKMPPKVKVSDVVKGKRDYGKLVCAYDYQNAEGAVVFRVERRVMANGKKTFVQSHPDPTSKFGWKWGVTSAGVERVPFRLPRILAAGKAGKSVIVVEGEKDVLTVEKCLGVAATCNPGGAGKWEAGWGKFFEGVKTVCIIADKDAEETEKKVRGKMTRVPFAVGQRHACDVEAKLRADGFTGAIKKMYMPDVGETHVKDFTDWAEAVEAAGGKADRAAFQEVVKNFTGWPEEWEFGASGEKGESGETEEPDGECVRFGVEIPRSPDRLARTYRVEYRVGGSFTVDIEMNWRELHYEWTTADANGHRKWHDEWRTCTLPMMIFWSRKMVEEHMGRDAHLNASQQSALQSQVALAWLRSRGKFFWDETAKGYATSMYFDDTTGVLMRVRSDEFMSFVATAAEINRESTGFKYLMSLVDDASLSVEASQGVEPSNSICKRGDAVYVSSGDSEMYRIKGGLVEKVNNGSDGVVFMRGKTLLPWNLKDGAGVDPFANCGVFSTASYLERGGQMNLRLWVLNLFYCHETKPILLVHGPMQTGKTRIVRAIKEMLGVQRGGGKLDHNVNTIDPGDKGCEAYWVAINDGFYEIFDNADGKPPSWFSNAVQTSSTGGEKKSRKLYSNGEVVLLRANANQAFTANDPKFMTEGKGGMADRVIGIELKSDAKRKQKDKEFSVEIKRQRDEFMTWMVRIVAKAMTDTGEVDETVNRRHPDYGEFSIRCGRAFGDEVGAIRALSEVETDKILIPLRKNEVTRNIIEMLSQCEPKWQMEFTSGEASKRIVEMIGDMADEKTADIYNSRNVGVAFSGNLDKLRMLFKIGEKKTIHGIHTWFIEGLTARGEAALGGEGGVGEVISEKSAGSENAQAFAETRPPTPPTPPGADARARARADDTSFDVEEEISKENGGGDDLVW